MAIMLAAALLVQTATPAAWIPAGSDARGSYSYDDGSISRGPGTVSMRIRAVAPSTGPNGVRTVIMQVTMDCAARTLTSNGMEAYHEDGRHLGSVPGQSAPMPIPPGSVEDGMLGQLCR